MSSIKSVFPVFRQTLTRHPFICSTCITRQLPTKFQQPASLLSNCRPLSLKNGHSYRKGFSSITSKSIQSNVQSSSLAQNGLIQSVDSERADTARSRKSSFPNTSDKSVAYWLLGSAASVFGIVVFGGLTRLTESGYVGFKQQDPAEN
jgi:heme a synthase